MEKPTGRRQLVGIAHRGIICSLGLLWVATAVQPAGGSSTSDGRLKEAIRLQNQFLILGFDPHQACLSAITNRLTGETYSVQGDVFAVEATDFFRRQADLQRVDLEATTDQVIVRYADADLSVVVTYGLRPADHFFRKRVDVTLTSDGGVKQIMVSRPTFTLEGLEVFCYRHPDFERLTRYVKAKHGWNLRRPADSEPARTFFGRTSQGGFFTGLAMAYDDSRQDRTSVRLGYAPNLKVEAGSCLIGEPMYFGVYRSDAHDARASEWVPVPAEAFMSDSSDRFNGAEAAGLSDAPSTVLAPVTATQQVLPLPSESKAMTAMASVLLGPPRHGLKAFACGWHSQMEQATYDSDEKLEGDLHSLDFLASCGLDGVSDPHPWGGETAKMAGLRDGDHYEPDARVRRFLEYAREVKLDVVQWPTINNTHPWREYGGPFRPDRPEWLRGVEGDMLGGANAANFRQRKANCLACQPFYEWLAKIILDDALGTGLYGSWCMDGDFWGTGAYFHTTLPVTCQAANHDHLPGDANYACQRRLDELFARVRQQYPKVFICSCRPKMDLGVWAQRNVDCCFTLIESGTSQSNITAGDEIRTASRIRVHHQFFPHWMDMALLFPSYGDPKRVPQWPSSYIDYIMLSALSCSPNLVLYLPTKTEIPEADKAEIRKWLDWGRHNEKYLLARRDLFDWPGKGRVDGSAHIVGDSGIVFLFNSGEVCAAGRFGLTDADLGLSKPGRFNVSQEYPASGLSERHDYGATVTWQIPAQSAVILRLSPSAF